MLSAERPVIKKELLHTPEIIDCATRIELHDYISFLRPLSPRKLLAKLGNP